MCTACACGTESAQAEAAAETGAADGRVYRVSGMTCGHCVSSVSGEIGKVGGITGVTVDLPTGAVTVSGSGFTDEEIRAAVEQAGYTLAGQS
ncbi:heavy-metal-associated domain-containing protein [Microbispora cellulosiformans]|uniref:Heavy-metal-associated domain-containing protein n=1 Tax=Microbispora cellulosiformans TaxID=2614688 RepID=A0A5J5JW06_9ACTN|nr:heavy-metal-associated domain-containing protein [Microbispora cellulosiformans]KAA9375512.1 heavy-metal-associated domain-containing protein [Microbispora cellulosiformans]